MVFNKNLDIIPARSSREHDYCVDLKIRLYRMNTKTQIGKKRCKGPLASKLDDVCGVI